MLHKIVTRIYTRSNSDAHVEVFGGDTFDEHIQKIIESLEEIEVLIFKVKALEADSDDNRG